MSPENCKQLPDPKNGLSSRFSLINTWKVFFIPLLAWNFVMFFARSIRESESIYILSKFERYVTDLLANLAYCLVFLEWVVLNLSAQDSRSHLLCFHLPCLGKKQLCCGCNGWNLIAFSAQLRNHSKENSVLRNMTQLIYTISSLFTIEEVELPVRVVFKSQSSLLKKINWINNS